MKLCRQVLQTLTLFKTKIVHFASLFFIQDTFFHYLDSCCKIPNISFADLFSIYIFLLIRSSEDDDDDECEYIYSAQYYFLIFFADSKISTCTRIRIQIVFARPLVSTCIGIRSSTQDSSGNIGNRACVVKRLKFASCSTLCYIWFSILSLELWQHPLRNQTKMQRVRAKQLSWRLRPRSVFGSFGVVLMSCKVNFHVVRSALQNSVCLRSVYFCWSGLLEILRFSAYSFAVVCSLNVYLKSKVDSIIWTDDEVELTVFTAKN